MSLDQGKASKHDAFWLVLTTVNCALLLWLLPDKLLKADWLDVLSGKVAPWLATSAFVAGYTWWTDEILQFSRTRAFRVSQAVMFVPLLLTEVPLVTVRAEVRPSNAQLWIDGQRTTRSRVEWRAGAYVHDMRLLLKPHRFELKPPAYWEQKGDVAQEIELGWGDMVSALWQRHEFHWSLVWPVTFSALCNPERVIAIREGREAFDASYLATWALDQEVLPVEEWAPFERLKLNARDEYQAVEVPVPNPLTRPFNPVTVRLPAGTYWFVAVGANGEDWIPQTISSRQQSFLIRFVTC